MRRRFLLVGGWVAACSPAQEPIVEVELEEAYYVHSWPADVATNVGQIAPMVFVHTLGGGLMWPEAQAGIEELARGIELATWPEGTRVEVSARIESDERVPDSVVRIVLEPQAKLEDRWHAVLLPAQLPNGLHPWAEGADLVPIDGRWGARFRPDPQPLFRGVTFCGWDDGSSLAVEYSEPVAVRLGAPPLISVFQRGREITCSRPMAGESAQLDIGCDAMRADEPIDITVPAGIRTSAGAELPPVSVTFTPEEAAFASDCFTFRSHEPLCQRASRQPGVGMPGSRSETSAYSVANTRSERDRYRSSAASDSFGLGRNSDASPRRLRNPTVEASRRTPRSPGVVLQLR